MLRRDLQQLREKWRGFCDASAHAQSPPEAVSTAQPSAAAAHLRPHTPDLRAPAPSPAQQRSAGRARKANPVAAAARASTCPWVPSSQQGAGSAGMHAGADSRGGQPLSPAVSGVHGYGRADAQQAWLELQGRHAAWEVPTAEDNHAAACAEDPCWAARWGQSSSSGGSSVRSSSSSQPCAEQRQRSEGARSTGHARSLRTGGSDAGCCLPLDSLHENSNERRSSNCSQAGEPLDVPALSADIAWPPPVSQQPDTAPCTTEQQREQHFAAELWQQACEAAHEEACGGGACSGREGTPSRLDALAAQCLSLFERSQQPGAGSREEPALKVRSPGVGAPGLAGRVGPEGESPWLAELVAAGNELMQQLEQEGCIGGGLDVKQRMDAGYGAALSSQSSTDLFQHYIQRGRDMHAASAMCAAD